VCIFFFVVVAYDRIKAAATNSEMMVIEENSKWKANMGGKCLMGDTHPSHHPFIIKK
jgi:hypothetical protein